MPYASPLSLVVPDTRSQPASDSILLIMVAYFQKKSSPRPLYAKTPSGLSRGGSMSVLLLISCSFQILIIFQ